MALSETVTDELKKITRKFIRSAQTSELCHYIIQNYPINPIMDKFQTSVNPCSKTYVEAQILSYQLFINDVVSDSCTSSRDKKLLGNLIYMKNTLSKQKIRMNLILKDAKTIGIDDLPKRLEVLHQLYHETKAIQKNIMFLVEENYELDKADRHKKWLSIAFISIILGIALMCTTCLLVGFFATGLIMRFFGTISALFILGISVSPLIIFTCLSKDDSIKTADNYNQIISDFDLLVAKSHQFDQWYELTHSEWVVYDKNQPIRNLDKRVTLLEEWRMAHAFFRKGSVSEETTHDYNPSIDSLN